MKHQLLEKLKQIDKKRTGKVNLQDFLGSSASFNMYLDSESLKKISKKETVNYSKLLGKLVLNRKLNKWYIVETPKDLSQTLREEAPDIRQFQIFKSVFAAMGGDTCTPVEAKAFEAQLLKSKSSFSRPLLKQITAQITREGKVHMEGIQRLINDYNFSRVSSKVYSERNFSSSIKQMISDKSSQQDLLHELQDKLSLKFRHLTRAFRYFDSDFDSKVYLVDLATGINNLNMQLSVEQVKKIFNYLDKARKGYLNFEDFCQIGGKSREDISPVQPQLSTPAFNQKFEEMTQNPRRRKFLIPSDRDPLFAYGSKTTESENIKKLLENSFQRKFITELKHKYQTIYTKPTKKFPQYSAPKKSSTPNQKPWKLSKFEKVPSKIRTFKKNGKFTEKTRSLTPLRSRPILI